MTENLRAQLPESVWILLVSASPESSEERNGPPIPHPLVLELVEDGPGYLVVLSSEEYAEEFRQGLDIGQPTAIKEVSLQELLGVLTILERDAEHVLIDPPPPGEWGSGEERGFTLPSENLISILEERLQNN